MSGFQYTIGQRTYHFDSLATLLAKATPLRSGDELAGLPRIRRKNGWRRRWRWPICR